MIFQKKIIIGSIMSFIATAVGVIAVFFPDLLNMQKDKIDKLTLHLYEKKDANQLIKFISKHKGKIIELNLTYCAGVPSESEPVGDDYRYDSSEQAPSNGINLNIFSKYNPGADFPSTREQGYLEFTGYDPNLEKDITYHLDIQEQSNDGEKYLWLADAGILPESAQGLCKVSPTDEYGAVGSIKGTFLVVPGKASVDYIYDILAPLSQKELMLRNY